jgi:hypothetical protein
MLGAGAGLMLARGAEARAAEAGGQYVGPTRTTRSRWPKS